MRLHVFIIELQRAPENQLLNLFRDSRRAVALACLLCEYTWTVYHRYSEKSPGLCNLRDIWIKTRTDLTLMRLALGK